MPEAAEKELALPEEQHAEIFDLADEEQIVSQLQGRVSEKFVYELKGVKDERGQPVRGLSFAGTNWACREYAKQGEVIRIVGKPEYAVDPTDPDYVLVSVMAQRFAVHPETGRESALDTQPGLKRQWRKMKRNKWENGHKVGEEFFEDPFFWEKGLSKATRNAKQALIPTDIVLQLITQALKNKQSQGVPPDGSRGRSRSAPSKSAPARTAPPRGPQAASPPAASGSAPPQGAAQAGPPAGAPSKGTPAGTGGSGQGKDVLIQKVDMVLKAALQTQDAALARQVLKQLTGSDKLGNLSEDDLKKYGKILQGIPKGIYAFSEDKSHIFEVQGGDVVLGSKPAEGTAPPPQDTPPAEGKDGDWF
jgi:hypothetical protein